jgi:hypothetical protein
MSRWLKDLWAEWFEGWFIGCGWMFGCFIAGEYGRRIGLGNWDLNTRLIRQWQTRKAKETSDPIHPSSTEWAGTLLFQNALSRHLHERRNRNENRTHRVSSSGQTPIWSLFVPRKDTRQFCHCCAFMPTQKRLMMMMIIGIHDVDSSSSSRKNSCCRENSVQFLLVVNMN